MSKAEEYIVLASDENGQLCDTKALRAVKIAREEMLNEICEWIGKQKDLLEDSFSDPNDFADILKQAMEE